MRGLSLTIYFFCAAYDYIAKSIVNLVKHISIIGYTRCSVKTEPLIFDYNSRISMFIILLPMETGVNTLQSHVIYLR